MSTGTIETVARPLYQQVVDIMMRRIAEGHWKSGQMLPSEPKLALELGVSPGTVRKALDQLAAEQLVTRRQGLGTSVAVSTREDMLYRFFKLIDESDGRFMPECEEISCRVEKATEFFVKLFSLKSKSKIIRVLRRRHNGDQPIMTELVSLPLVSFAGIDKLPDSLPTTLYDFFETDYGLKVLRVDEKLTADIATPEDVELLGVAAGSALLAIERTAFTFNNQIIEHRISRLSTSNHAYLSELT